MKLSVDENYDILLEHVYSGVGFKTDDGNTLGVCMRDGTFEINFNGRWYRANPETGDIEFMCVALDKNWKPDRDKYSEALAPLRDKVAKSGPMDVFVHPSDDDVPTSPTDVQGDPQL